LILYFNGTNPKDSNESAFWQNKEKIKYQNVATLINGLTNNPDNTHIKGWMKPVNLVRQILNQLRLNKINKVNKIIHAFYSVKFHQKEMLDFCKLNKIEFLLSSDSELMMLLLSQKLENSIRLFSAKSFKLTFRGIEILLQLTISVYIFSLFLRQPRSSRI
jgi:hypothetical protein